MGDKQKVKIENLFTQFEERFEAVPKMTASDKRSELKKLEAALNDLDSDIQRFLMTEYVKFPDACEQFEEKFNELTEKFKTLDQNGEAGGDNDPAMDESQANDATQKQIMETNAKLKEGKNRAVAMLHTINNMKEEISLIDDEVVQQREKMLSINHKLKETQSVLVQTKRLVAFFSKAVYDDVIIKILIGLICVAIIVILAMAINIKIKKSGLEGDKKTKELEAKDTENYDDIDETMFLNFAKGKKYAEEKYENETKKPPKKAAVQIKPKETDPVNENITDKAQNDVSINKENEKAQPTVEKPAVGETLKASTDNPNSGLSTPENTPVVNNDEKANVTSKDTVKLV